jgi:hypothetical protein
MILDHQAQGNSRATLPGQAIRFAINYPSSPTVEKG